MPMYQALLSDGAPQNPSYTSTLDYGEYQELVNRWENSYCFHSHELGVCKVHLPPEIQGKYTGAPV